MSFFMIFIAFNVYLFICSVLCRLPSTLHLAQSHTKNFFGKIDYVFIHDFHCFQCLSFCLLSIALLSLIQRTFLAKLIMSFFMIFIAFNVYLFICSVLCRLPSTLHLAQSHTKNIFLAKLILYNFFKLFIAFHVYLFIFSALYPYLIFVTDISV